MADHYYHWNLISCLTATNWKAEAQVIKLSHSGSTQLVHEFIDERVRDFHHEHIRHRHFGRRSLWA